MDSIFILTILPILSGILMLLVPRKSIKSTLAIATLGFSFSWSIFIFFSSMPSVSIRLIGNYHLLFTLNPLSKTILIFINLFGMLVCFYSKDYMQQKEGAFFSYLIWLIAFSNLMSISGDFISFIFSWGATLILLYALMSFGSGYSAKKAFTILGLADFSFILGVALYIGFTGSTQMPIAKGIMLDRPVVWWAFILMLTGALAKAGCWPFHTWIPEAAEDVPIPAMAILPASLDKLMGIYLLARICLDFFVLNKTAMGLLLIIGSLTIIFAVMMALIQHDLRKLLSYHAISQVGYMVLGFGTGIPIGIAGGIFHMINNAIYKTGLFLSGGAVGKQRKTFELDQLGGLARYMPFVFMSALVFSLSISGMPPFNGFASKWMLYQGTLLGFMQNTNSGIKVIFIFSLVAAMFGSSLTLASFVKFIHAVFLGQSNYSVSVGSLRNNIYIILPLGVLAILCLLLGVLPAIFLKTFIQPYLVTTVYPWGKYNAPVALSLIILALIAGLLIWGVMQGKLKIRKDNYFIGTEMDNYKYSFSATEFYRTIEGVGVISGLYKILKTQFLDLYNIVCKIFNLSAHLFYMFIDRLIYILTNAAGYVILGLSWILRRFHYGVLDFYLVWALFGLMVVIFILTIKGI